MSSSSPNLLLPLLIQQRKCRGIIVSSEIGLEDNFPVLVPGDPPVCGGLEGLLSDSAGVFPQSSFCLGISGAGEFWNTVNRTCLVPPSPASSPQYLNYYRVHDFQPAPCACAFFFFFPRMAVAEELICSSSIASSLFPAASR